MTRADIPTDAESHSKEAVSSPSFSTNPALEGAALKHKLTDTGAEVPKDALTYASTSEAFLDAIATRHSQYAIKSTSSIPDTQILSILTRILNTVPSAFNSQSSRIVLLLNADHGKLWDIVLSTLTDLGKATEATSTKLAGFKKGYGTVLFYEDTAVVKGLQEKFQAYADKFESWSDQTSGMHQLAVWTAFAKEGLGGSLQHYSPVIDQAVREQWGVNEGWRLVSQMPFGEFEVPAQGKPKVDAKEKMKVFGSSEGGVSS